MPINRLITATFMLAGQHADITFSGQLSLYQLGNMLSEGHRQLRWQFPERWELRLQNKHLRLSSHVPLGAYPVGTGDVFVIQSIEE